MANNIKSFCSIQSFSFLLAEQYCFQFSFCKWISLLLLWCVFVIIGHTDERIVIAGFVTLSKEALIILKWLKIKFIGFDMMKDNIVNVSTTKRSAINRDPSAPEYIFVFRINQFKSFIKSATLNISPEFIPLKSNDQR